MNIGKTILLLGLSGLVVFFLIFLYISDYPKQLGAVAEQFTAQVKLFKSSKEVMQPKDMYINYPNDIMTGSVALKVSFATTSAQQAQGLSGVESLPDGAGMFFVFSESGRYSFWMKNMLIPIDIIWIDSSGVVVDITDNISPETYPTTFVPNKPIRYVLEVPAGYTSRAGIRIGDKVTPLPNM